MNIPEVIQQITVAPDSTIRVAMQAIDTGRIGVALICDTAGRFISLATDGDLRRALLNGHGLQSSLSVLGLTPKTTARVGMSPEEISALFTEDVRVIPVLDPENFVATLACFDRRSYIPVARPVFGEKELLYVSECVLSGWVSSTGKFVTKFEQVFAEFCRVPHAVSTSNGTTALHLAMLVCEIGPGDEVIVPSLSFIASANAVSYTGARPVLVDSDPVTWNLDPAAVRQAITPRTKAIMAVHLYGHPADMRALRAICDEHRLLLIEDAAEAHGATFDGMPTGGLGDIACFSFFGNKIITTGEGGMLVTANPTYAANARVLRDHGMRPERRYWHPVLGYNYRMTNLQAALGVAQMERIDSIIEAKRRVARNYARGLADIEWITCPVELAPAKSVWWLYSILIDEKKLGASRDRVGEHLKKHGIETRPVFIPIHKQPIYDTGAHHPVAEDISARGISLPSEPALTDAEVQRICALLHEMTPAAVAKWA